MAAGLREGCGPKPGILWARWTHRLEPQDEPAGTPGDVPAGYLPVLWQGMRGHWRVKVTAGCPAEASNV
jgi:hypothetical protein